MKSNRYRCVRGLRRKDETMNRSYTATILMFRLSILCSLVLLLCAAGVQADTIQYTDSGTFTTATPSSAFTAPGGTWSFSFDAVTNPTDVLEFGNGGFNFAFFNFTYTLNGSPVAITPTYIRFFSGTNGGGFFVCFSGTFPPLSNCTDALGTPTFGPQMYAGMTSAPTLIPGAFTQAFAAGVNGTGYPQADTTVQANAVPEPNSGSLLIMGVGMLGLLSGRKLLFRV